MSFKIGDYVINTKVQDNNHYILNKIGIIRAVMKDTYTVEFPFPFHGGHKGYLGKGKPNHCWDIDEDKLKLTEARHKEDLVKEKCRWLWNNSKYISNNPSQAY